MMLIGGAGPDAAADSPSFAQRHGVDPARERTYAVRPLNVQGVISDRGAEGVASVPANVHPGTVVPHLNPAKFVAALHASLKDSVNGYAMQLRQHGKPLETIIWNWAQTPADGSVGWSLDTRAHIASVSKLMTGIGLAKALDDAGVPWNTKIAGYLPAYWVQGPNIAQITFADLMTHQTGFFANGATDYQTMKDKVAAGVATGAPGGASSYENMNYGLCRILIPIVAKQIDKTDRASDLVWDLATIQEYWNYLQKNVFGPSGVTQATLDHPAKSALAYTFPSDGKPGWNSGDLETAAGAAGWHMTVNEVLDVMGTFRRSGKIVPAVRAQAALDAQFGIDVIQGTPAGNVYEKNGRWTDHNPPGSHTEQAVVYFLPDDMELAVIANSNDGNPAVFLRGAVATVYQQNLQ
jgi:CubicO group peptidase (beta-lactamase class C family)